MSFTMNQASTTTKPETFMLSAEQLDSLPAEAKAALEQVDDLKYFLATAPANWQVDQIIRRYLLPTGEYVSCVLWRNLFHVTGTDIVRALTYRFQAFGRPVRNVKKFEEGIFSDLRNLKPGTDASLEEPKSAFLDLLYKNNCIRTQKKQKVFYWFSVPHDRLFLDALERDLKRERMGTETTTEAVQEPALSFVFDATQSLYEQLTKSLQQNAASEVGATLAAQQAQHNLMSGQYPGAVQTYPSGPHYSPRVGPSESYHRRSQSIQSAVPIDYRNQSNDAPQPPTYQTGPLGFEVHHTTPVHAITNNRAATSMSFRDFPSYMNSGTSFPVEDAYRRRALSFDRSVESSFPMPLESGIYEMNRDLSTSNVIQAPMVGNSYGNSMDTFGTHDFQVLAPQQGPAYSETNDGFAGPYDIPGDFLGLQGENNNFSIPPRVPMNFGLPIHFSPFEGSPTYKQRRRRQSIPSSLLLAEQAAQAQQRQRAATEPHQLDKTIYQINDAGSTATAGLPQYQLDGHAAPVDVAPNFTGYGENLSYQHDDRIAELEQNISRVGSDSDIGSPYPTKSYNCPIPGCERLFKRLEHLKRHVRTHTQERPYECEICDKRFSRSDNLAQHRKTHERGSSSSSSAAPEFRNANFYKDRRFGKKSETPSHYDSLELDCDAEQQWQNRRIDSYNPDRRLPILESGGPHRTFDPTAFSLDHCPEEVQESICLDPVQFRESLNPPSPRSLPNPHVCRSESSSGHCDITPLDSISVFSTASEVSQAYVPVAVSSSELYASRKHALTESWVDDEATPRQERFSLAETFSIPREISDMRQSTNGQLSWS